MHDGVDLILSQNPFQQCAITDVSASYLDVVQQPGAYELTLRNPVPHEANYVPTCFEQPPD
jgi:hypothetical protein